jgi:2-iminobutanoate/2-iminopropanoate deaminase
VLGVNAWAQQKQVVATPDAPKAIGPYSQAIKAGGLVFTAGQIPLDPIAGQIAGADTAAQTDRVLKNLQAVLQAAGADLEHVVKTTIFLKNISDFATVNEVYGRYFKNRPPARSTVQVANLPREALVEIEAIATLPGSH